MKQQENYENDHPVIGKADCLPHTPAAGTCADGLQIKCISRVCTSNVITEYALPKNAIAAVNASLSLPQSRLRKYARLSEENRLHQGAGRSFATGLVTFAGQRPRYPPTATTLKNSGRFARDNTNLSQKHSSLGQPTRKALHLSSIHNRRAGILFAFSEAFGKHQGNALAPTSHCRVVFLLLICINSPVFDLP